MFSKEDSEFTRDLENIQNLRGIGYYAGRRIEKMINRENGVPIYIQIQDYLEEMIRNGQLKPNDLVPSENEMAETLKVSRLTVRKSYVEMVKRGFFYTMQGKGTFVKEHCLKDGQAQTKYGPNDIIGVILPEVQIFYGEIFEGIRKKCEDYGFSLQLMFNNEVHNEITSIEHFIKSNVKGIIISPSRHANTIIEHYQKLLSSYIPTVMVGRPPFKISASSVSCNEVFGVYRAVELLISHGNTAIGYVKNSAYLDSASEERFNGYLAALNDYFPGDKPITIDMNSPSFHEELVKSVRGANPVTAFFCYCDAGAAVVYNILTDAGIKVPQEVELIGYDNLFSIDGFNPNVHITSVDQRRGLMGEESVNLLVQLMTKGEARHSHTEVIIHPKLVEKDTTRI